MAVPFNGQLYTNKIVGGMFNMIIRETVESGNIKGTYSELVDMSRVEGTLFGDQIIFVDTDKLSTHDWNNYDEAANLLDTDRVEDPDTQTIVMDVFKQIRLTLDDYLTKQAWTGPDAFGTFQSVMQSWITSTKKIYESKTFNVFVGTTETSEGKQTQTIDVNAGENFGLLVAEKLANVLVDLKNPSRVYNDFYNTKSFAEEDLIVVWNSDVYNAIKKIDLPVIFHKDGLVGEFEQHVIPSYFFGTPVGKEHNEQTTDPNNTTIRTRIEKRFDLPSVATGASGKTAATTEAKRIENKAKMDKNGVWYVICDAGDIIPGGVDYYEDEAYEAKDDIAFKLIHKRSIPFMSAFTVGTSFFNPRALLTNHYLTFGHNTLEYLRSKPFITVKTQEV